MTEIPVIDPLKYDLESLEQHWKDLVYQLCASIAVLDLLNKTPTDEEIDKLEGAAVLDKANEVFSRAVVALEHSYIMTPNLNKPEVIH